MDTKGSQVFHQHQVKGSQAGWMLFLDSSLRRRESESEQGKQEHRLLPRTNVETVSIPGTSTGTGFGHGLSRICRGQQGGPSLMQVWWIRAAISCKVSPFTSC